MQFFLVFLGSGIGGMARHAVGLLSLRLFGPNFPIGTMTINIVGSALMGVVIGIFAARSQGEAEVRLFLTTGIIGGFTTFSTFSLDAAALYERGEFLLAALYVIGSVVLGIAALFATMLTVRYLLR